MSASKDSSNCSINSRGKIFGCSVYPYFLCLAEGKDNKTHTEDQLALKDLDIEVRYADLDFHFQNLMGGGIVGRHVQML